MLTTAPLSRYHLVRYALGGGAALVAGGTAAPGSARSAAATASTLELRALFARVAVSEAQHVAVLDRIRGAAAAPSFPDLFDVEQASAALGPFFGE
jgi:hypothetical protein